MRALGRHGLLPEEQARPQPFEVDLALEIDLAPAGRSDQLALTVDYGALGAEVVGVVEGTSVALLERLAEMIAEVALRHPGVAAVEVTVRKLRPPVPYHLEAAAVTLRRQSPG